MYYSSLSKEFNDIEVVISHPSNACKLTGFNDMNPNDHSRINIERDGKFIKYLLSDTLKHYRIASDKWKMDTGGGSGFPKDYVNWEERNDELFTNYDSSSREYLAWIYMLDKSVGFILDAKNDPVPLNVWLEDGTTPSVGNDSKSRPKRDISDIILEEIKDASKRLEEAITSVKHKTSYNDVLNSINMSEDLKLKLKESKSKMSASVKKRHLNIFDKSISDLYDKLDSLGNIIIFT